MKPDPGAPRAVIGTEDIENIANTRGEQRMPKITFIEHNGTPHQVDAVAGLSLMRAAVDNGVPGIDADCGGECACATCHVYVEPEWFDRTGERSEMEQSMLGFAAVTQDNSRLSCQVVVSDALDGLVVRLPDGQH